MNSPGPRPAHTLLLSPTSPATGNTSTIARIASFLPPSEFTLLDARAITPPDLLAAITAHCPRAVVLLHALHSGRLLAALTAAERARVPPGILVLGGTDVSSSDTLSEADGASFAAAVAQACVVVAFSADLGERFLRVASELGICAPPPLRVIAQSILPCDVPRGGGAALCDPRAALGLAPSRPLVIFAGSLRAVKDPLFVLAAWADWAARTTTGVTAALLIVGPTLDDELGAAVVAAASPAAGIYCHASVPRDVLLAWFSHADAVLNTSRTEGQSNTMLEAMSVGTPVIARNVDGNASIILNGGNGLLFDTAEGAVALVAAVCGLPFHSDCAALQSVDAPAAEALASAALYCGAVDDAARESTPTHRTYLSRLGARIAQSAALSVAAHHAVDTEGTAWRALLDELPDVAAVRAATTPATSYTPRPYLSLGAAQRTASRDAVDVLAWLGSRAPFSPVVDTAEILVGARALHSAPLFWGGANGNADVVRWPHAPRVFNLSAASASEAEEGPGWGRYGENRGIYSSSAHFTGAAPRTLHLGVDLGVASLTSVASPLAARVHSVGLDAAPLGYGPTVVLAHAVAFTRADGSRARAVFYTLYGHLSAASVFGADGAPRRGLARGDRVRAGEPFATVGSRGENGGWFPHVHFQIVTELGLGRWEGDWPGVARLADEAAYRVLAPDANLLLRCPWVCPIGWLPDGGRAVTAAEVVDVLDEELEAAGVNYER